MKWLRAMDEWCVENVAVILRIASSLIIVLSFVTALLVIDANRNEVRIDAIERAACAMNPRGAACEKVVCARARLIFPDDFLEGHSVCWLGPK